MIMVNLFIHNLIYDKYSYLLDSIKSYLNDDTKEASDFLNKFLIKNKIEGQYLSFALEPARQTILGLGNEDKQNDYLTFRLEDFILKNKDLGSFDLMTEVHNFIRLSLYQKRKMDISSISVFFMKYYNRNDYSLFNVDAALRTFEKNDFIESKNSYDLIKSIQEISEKGYSDLMYNYLNNQTKIIQSKNSLSQSKENYNQGILSIEALYMTFFLKVKKPFV